MKKLILLILLTIPLLCFAQSEELAIAESGNKYGIISLVTGKTILPFTHDSIDVSMEGYIYAKKGNKWSLIDSNTGKRITPFLYDSLYGLEYHNLFVGKTRKGYVMIDGQGKEISDHYEEMNHLHREEALQLSSTDKCMKYDLVNQVVAGCDTIFRDYLRNIEPRFKIVGNDKFNGVKNLVTGELVIPYQYYIQGAGDYYIVCDSLTKGRAWANYGIMDTLGNMVLSPKYNAGVRWLKIFAGKSSLFRIRKDGKCGILDADTRQFTVPMTYKDIQVPGGDSFYGDFVFAQNDTGKYGLINAFTGETKQPHIYDKIRYEVYQPGVYFTICNNKKGLLLDNGELVVPCEYDFVTLISRHTHFIVDKGGKQGVYNRTGKLVLPVEYDRIEYGVSYADEPLFDTAIVRLKKGDSSILYNLLTMKEEKFFTYEGQVYLQTNYPVIIAPRPGYPLYSLVNGLNGAEIVKEKSEIRILDDSLLYARTHKSMNNGNNLTEIINYKTNEILLSLIDRDINHISGKYFFLFEGDKSTVYDIEKKENVFPDIYDTIEIISPDTAIVSQGGKYGIINYQTRKVCTSLKYQSILPVWWFMPP